MRKNTSGAAIKTRDYTLSIQSSDKVWAALPLPRAPRGPRPKRGPRRPSPVAARAPLRARPPNSAPKPWPQPGRAPAQVLELIPGDTKSLYRRALANWRLGEIEKASVDLEAILKNRVNDYQEVAESAVAKKAARKLLRQIEESEERAELVEVRMAKALAVEIPKLNLSESNEKSGPDYMQLPGDVMPL